MEYDVAIIGGGPGGYVAGIRAAQRQLKTVLFEKNKLGGTCLNVGCIPTKVLVKNAEILHAIRNAASRGIVADPPVIDMRQMLAAKQAIVDRLTSGVEALLKSNGVEVVCSEAHVTSTHTLEANGREYSFKNLIIASGSSNYIPPIPGLSGSGILTSTELLELEEIPATLAIIGGGVIGCEMATIYSSLGSEVTVIEMQPRLLPLMDKTLSLSLKQSFAARGIRVLTKCGVSGVSAENGRYVVEVSGGKDSTFTADKVLVSVGRKANLAGLDALGLELAGGYLKVDDRMATSIGNIYAVGDITGIIQLAHVASAQAIIAAENIARGESAMAYDKVPGCVYTIPEIGSVGLTEDKAKEVYGDVVVSKFPLMACGKAVAMGETEGFVKLVAEADTGRLLGCHCMGAAATEIIAEAALALQNGNTIQDISHTIHAHPTISESIAEAAHLAEGMPIHMAPR
ncbi:MAG: dihydrolipoyl dehydrogenase [Clostridiales Family XIII bacterium]|jgi:dihydrolipoamide dehydrogenase|nr:dihydrolipoyl dehydrogenase [Clostridiales Family XIII bacterium]